MADGSTIRCRLQDADVEHTVTQCHRRGMSGDEITDDDIFVSNFDVVPQFNLQTRSTKLVSECIQIYRLEKTRPERPMNLHRESDYVLSQGVRIVSLQSCKILLILSKHPGCGR